MTRHLAPPARPRPRTAVLAVAVLTVALLAPRFAPAQSLPNLLPESSALAIGLVDLQNETDRLRPFLDEAERLGLFTSVGAAVPGEAGAALGAEAGPELPSAFSDLEPLDLLGQEAWIAVTTSPFQPFPAVTAIARPDEAARAAFETAIAEAAARPGTERRTEGGAEFWTYVPPTDDAGGDGLDLPVAYAQAGDVVVVSTDPEVVRFVLRARAGADEPTLADRADYAALRELGDGTVFGLLDLEPLLAGLAPIAEANGAGAILARLRDAARSAGPMVGLMRADDAGLVTHGLQLPPADGPDAALRTLLTTGTAPGADVLAFAPATTVAVSAGALDVAGWWAWLDDVAASAADLGVPTATEALAMVGVDVDAALLSWAGDRWGQIRTAPAEAVAPGATDAQLLGGGVTLLATTDDAAARAGLSTLLGTLGATAAGFVAPSGQGMAAPETVQVAGVDVQRLTLGPNLVLDAAVVDGWAVLSGSPEATEAVLTAHAAGGAAPERLRTAATELPADALSWSLSDDVQDVGGSASVLVGQLQMLAGLGGASTLDFDAVDEASDAVAAYAAFVAERLGTSRAVRTVEDGVIRSEGRTDVRW